MRILLYNWVPFDDPERRGGGVRVYQQNLLDHLVEHTDHEIAIVSSGVEHDLFDRSLRFTETENAYGGRVRSFAVVNSPVLAPGHHAFGDPAVMDDSTLWLWHGFLRENGPFDVVQFDSLEGIPVPWLRVHEALPGARVGVYLHNYYAVCPQVNLWKRESEHCSDYHDGHDCASCLLDPAPFAEVRRAHQYSRALRSVGVKPGTMGYALAYRGFRSIRTGGRRAGKVSRLIGERVLGSPSRSGDDSAAPVSGGEGVELRLPGADEHHTGPVSLRERNPGETAARYRHRREGTAALINREADVVLATSHRVREVVAARGIDPDLTQVCYIGTKVASQEEPGLRRSSPHVPGQLTLAYLGYMRRDKGFYFLIDALERASDELLGRLRLVVGAKIVDPHMERRMTSLASRMVDVLHVDGYQHDELPRLLASVDVGVVPVLWEDNLPQVAIEMRAQGLPLVTADRGGAQELGGDNLDFTFQAGNADDFRQTVGALADGRTSLDSYWDEAIELMPMSRHVDRLLHLYGGVPRPGPGASGERDPS